MANENGQLTNEMLQEAFEKFITERNKPHSRFLSWEHCIGQFADAFKSGKRDDATVDYLSLHLGFFLASWGMIRGSTKLLWHDYKVHEPVVKTILSYSDLYGKDLQDFRNPQTLGRFGELYKEIVAYCKQFSTNGDKASETLVGKIIMGTLGIAPAYDKFVKKAVKKYGISQGKFNTKAFEQFARYFTENFADITNKMTKEAQELCQHYTRAKVIDSILWFIGQD